jgi:hypothetical protein
MKRMTICILLLVTAQSKIGKISRSKVAVKEMNPGEDAFMKTTSQQQSMVVFLNAKY